MMIKSFRGRDGSLYRYYAPDMQDVVHDDNIENDVLANAVATTGAMLTDFLNRKSVSSIVNKLREEEKKNDKENNDKK